MKFAIGDRVKRIGGSDYGNMQKGNTYTVSYVDTREIRVKEAGNENWDPDYFELVTGKTEEAKFKTGDTVKVINWGAMYSSLEETAKQLGATNYVLNDTYYYSKDAWAGTICTVIGVGVPGNVGGPTSGLVCIKAPNGIDYVISVQAVELIKSNNNPTIMDSIKTAYKNLFLSEPQKSFQKAGLTDACNQLTAEGTIIFLQWMLTKNESAFNTEVIQPILMEKAANKK